MLFLLLLEIKKELCKKIGISGEREVYLVCQFWKIMRGGGA